ncbi:hypothetical protein ACHAW6_009245 [Cyclotella cf. meneghiniana]
MSAHLNDDDMSSMSLPDPAPVGESAMGHPATVPPSAMTLFAPDPNADPDSLQSALDLDELFHDCYFGDFPVPEDVTSESTALPTKRTAETAGISLHDDLHATPLETASSSVIAAASKVAAASLTESQKIERRERNREHAKRSRLRKKFLLESLQEQIEGLQSEITTLKDIIRRELPEKATELLKGLEGDADGPPGQPKKGDYAPLPMPSGFGPVKTLMEPDYRLMSALSGSQQNFAISDPSLPDNPIVYVSQGFLDLTGYTLDQVLGRNCRFLQGPGTDQAAVDVIRRGVREGVDTSVCLLNYKADGSPFWNQFFVAALRDAENNVVNFVGVQCEVSKAVVDKHISEGKTPAPTSS